MPNVDKYLAISTTLIGALLFAMGYAYLRSYFGAFHISLDEIDLTIQDIVVFSVVALSKYAWFGAVTLLVAGLLVEREVKLRTLIKLSPTGQGLIFLSVAVVISWILLYSASSAGLSSAKAVFLASDTRYFWVPRGSKYESILKSIQDDVFAPELRFLHATDKTIFVVAHYRKLHTFGVVRLPNDGSVLFGVTEMGDAAWLR